MYLLGLAVEVARFSLPVLPFAFVGRQLDGVPVCQLKRLVDIQDALDIIIPGRNVFQAVARIAQRRRVPPRRGAGREPVHIHAESLLRLPREAELKPRLRLLLGRDYKHRVPVQRRRARLFGKRDLKTLGRHQPSLTTEFAARPTRRTVKPRKDSRSLGALDSPAALLKMVGVQEIWRRQL